jgi:hypothetical protein
MFLALCGLVHAPTAESGSLPQMKFELQTLLAKLLSRSQDAALRARAVEAGVVAKVLHEIGLLVNVEKPFEEEIALESTTRYLFCLFKKPTF